MTLSLTVLVAASPAREVRAQEADAGYPIDNETVIAECSRCHVRDDQGRMSRISYLRKTPEGWQTSLVRMMSLNGVSLEPEEARAIVRYLADEHGLAPEELRPGRFEVERRKDDYDYPGDSGVEFTCIQCHSMGRVITQRRTEEEWALLLETHRGLYPLIDRQVFRRSEGNEPHPMDEAIEHLSEAFPLETPEWTAWSVTKRAPRLTGEWTLSGFDPGAGPIYGTVTIAADPSDPARFTTQATYVYAETGEAVTSSGQALVYTGYQWRGSSTGREGRDLHEVMFVERDLGRMTGRWFSGTYDEFGPDVTLWRTEPGAAVAGVYPVGLVKGESASVTVYGSDLSTVASDYEFGEGVSVDGVESRAAGSVTLRLTVAPDAGTGLRDLYAGAAALEDAVAVHDGMDRIEVTPLTGLARTGGANFPKGFQTFDAIAYDDGPDGEPNTDDDLWLGRVDATWRLEEYAAVYGDDDIEYVGQILPNGVFDPAADGPNPDRPGNRNNIGDVWVVATHVEESGEEFSARGQLIVTVPLYIRFDPWPRPAEESTPVGGDQ